MIKFTSKDRNEYLDLPVKVEYEGKVYWIKRATKTDGLYMNSEMPKNVLLPEPNNLRKQV